MTTKRVHVLVSGEVQGVFFRAECASRSRAEGVAGYVRNLPDGGVEAVFEGEAQAVDRLVEWCRTGPQWANVTSVDVEERDPVGEAGFRIAH